MALYVDDIVLVGNQKEVIDKAKGVLQSCFEVNDMGDVNYILGVHVRRDKRLNTCSLSQKRYTQMLLDRFGMSDCHPVRKDLRAYVSKGQGGKAQHGKYPYRSLIGSLMYAAVCTRPDISYAITRLSQFPSTI